MGKRNVIVKPLRNPKLDARDGQTAQLDQSLKRLMAATEKSARATLLAMSSDGPPPNLTEWVNEINKLVLTLGAALDVEHVLVFGQGLEDKRLEVLTASSFSLDVDANAHAAARELLMLGLDTLTPIGCCPGCGEPFGDDETHVH